MIKEDKYTAAFLRLKMDRNRSRWPLLTRHAAPYKPFMLLSVMDLIGEGVITENRIPPSFDLVETFNSYCFQILPPGMKGNPAMPYYHLQNEGFWRLIPADGFDRVPQAARNSTPKLMETCSHAELDDSLFVLMQIPESREHLRAILIQKYFDKNVQPKLFEQAKVNYEAEQYSRSLMVADGRSANSGPEIFITEVRPVRDQGFRKAMVRVYEHRCAFCGIRMMTPDGHTVVDAAHIIPWSNSCDDRPQNGLCLCKLCHWSFDKKLMHLDDNYKIIVSSLVHVGNNLPGPIMSLDGRHMILPDEKKYWPGKKNIEWHRLNKKYQQLDSNYLF